MGRWAGQCCCFLEDVCCTLIEKTDSVTLFSVSILSGHVGNGAFLPEKSTCSIQVSPLSVAPNVDFSMRTTLPIHQAVQQNWIDIQAGMPGSSSFFSCDVRYKIRSNVS